MYNLIGDEILKGQTQDTNSHYMCKVLRSIGVVVSEICVIGDQLDVISSKVSFLQDDCNHLKHLPSFILKFCSNFNNVSYVDLQQFDILKFIKRIISS